MRRLTSIAVLLMAGLNICVLTYAARGNSRPQVSTAKPTDGKPRLKSHDSVTVTANFTPEETEDGKINDAYQPVFSVEQKGDCETAVLRYNSEVIPLAERSKFEVPKQQVPVSGEPRDRQLLHGAAPL